MRVALFIDGKNFYAGWKDATSGAEIDFRRMSQWIVRVAGGTTLLGAHYFTGVDTTIPPTPSQEKLDNFLDMIANQPGFFVQRFAQRHRTQVCPSCNHGNTFSQEKEVDTTIVADMLRLAAVNGFDIAVLLSGDADLVAAVEGVRALGKKVLVASWGSSGLSARIRRAAFDHIDLLAGMPEFGRQGHGYAAPAATGAPTFAAGASTPWNGWNAPTPAPVAPLSSDPEVHLNACVFEIGRAQAAMSNGYVGVHFFVTRWKSDKLLESADLRRRLIDRLVEQQKVEVYLTDDGMQAVRLNAAAPVGAQAPVPPRSPAGPVSPVSDDPAAHDSSCLEEIRRAQAAMPGGYIGAHFFVTRWKSGRLPEVPDLRRRTLDRLVEQGKVEIVLTEDGVQAVRLKSS